MPEPHDADERSPGLDRRADAAAAASGSDHTRGAPPAATTPAGATESPDADAAERDGPSTDGDATTTDSSATTDATAIPGDTDTTAIPGSTTDADAPDDARTDATGSGTGGDESQSPRATGTGPKPKPKPGAARPTRRSTLPLIVVPLIGLVVAGRVGDALAPTLVTENPALMILLNSTNRYLVLTTNQLDAPVYYSIGLFRLLLPDPLFYLLGYLYGDEAIRWMERRMPTVGSGIRKLEGWFDRAKYPLVFIMPNNPVCLLAGAAGMPVVPFLIVNVAGTIGRLWLMRVAGEVFEDWVDKLLELISTYRPWLLALSIGWVAIAVWSEWRKGSGQIEGLLELEEDLEEGTGSGTGTDSGNDR